MKRKNYFGINVGSSSILLIFIVLCLVSLAVLSLASSLSDYRLSQKVSTRQSAYYNACNEAEKELYKLDCQLSAQINQSQLSEVEFLSIHDSEYTYLFPFSDLQTLVVTVVPSYSLTEGQHYYRIIQWRSVINTNIDYDTTLHVLQ